MAMMLKPSQSNVYKNITVLLFYREFYFTNVKIR